MRAQEIKQLAGLAAETEDERTRAALLRAIVQKADQIANDGPRPPTLGERFAATLPDTLAVAAFAVFALVHVMAPVTASGFIMAVLAGRLYPRKGNDDGPPPPGGAPPASGVATLAGALLALATRGWPALASLGRLVRT